MFEEKKMAVAMSPAKNRSTLATIPTYAVGLLKILLRSITAEIISPAIKSVLRPAVLVMRKTSIPKNGRDVAINDQILLVLLSAT